MLPARGESERRHIERHPVERAARTGEPRFHADVRHRPWAARRSGTCRRQPPATPRMPGATVAQFARNPRREREFARGGRAPEVARVECRHERQYVLETHAVAACPQLRLHGVGIRKIDPAVECQRNGIQPQRVVRQRIASVRQVGLHLGFERGRRRRAAASRPRFEPHVLRTEGQRQIRAVGRQVAARDAATGAGGEMHARGSRRRSGAHRRLCARRAPRGGTPTAPPLRPRVLRPARAPSAEGFIIIPVHGAVGPLVRMELRTVEQHLGHLGSPRRRRAT